MKTKHTKGRWLYSTGSHIDKPSVKVHTRQGALTIATVCTEHLRQAAAIYKVKLPAGFTANEDEANAKLMAQAPRMLEVLKDVLEFFNGDLTYTEVIPLEKRIKKVIMDATL